jgi:hypothetical protein
LFLRKAFASQGAAYPFVERTHRPADIVPELTSVSFIFIRFSTTLYMNSFSSTVSSKKLTGRNPSLQEIIAECLFFIQPS